MDWLRARDSVTSAYRARPVFRFDCARQRGSQPIEGLRRQPLPARLLPGVLPSVLHECNLTVPEAWRPLSPSRSEGDHVHERRAPRYRTWELLFRGLQVAAMVCQIGGPGNAVLGNARCSDT